MSAPIASAALRPHPETTALPEYQNILLALDASDHANRATVEAAGIAALSNARVTGTHAYAAMLHDRRFRQMEGGLPEQFRVEQELERQRDVHDDLISRGLAIITDSYLDHAAQVCGEAQVEFHREALEGKNYRALTAATNSGNHDLLVIGARGLGAVPGERLGTVCSRVVRRAEIDTLVVKNPEASLATGPIVVAVDGSSRAWGGLLTALNLARYWHCPLHVVAAFDPYYHYVAFNRIAGVLSERASKIFRFQEQEKLHEEIIDSGLAKIYQGHLDVAETIVAGHGIEVTVQLLDGKPHDAIARYLQTVKPSLLIMGKLGVHADPGLDIGGNTEHLLRDADCAVLVSQREYQPPVEAVAEVTTSWTVEAEQSISRVPDFAQAMARTAILREASQRGHTVITAGMVEEITATLCPAHATRAMHDIVEADARGELQQPAAVGPMPWSSQAEAQLNKISDPGEQDNIRARSQKYARRQGAERVLPEHVAYFIGGAGEPGRPKCPFGHDRVDRSAAVGAAQMDWSEDAQQRLKKVPAGFMRDLTRHRIEAFAAREGQTEITEEVIEGKYAQWAAGSEALATTLPWQPQAQATVAKIPDFVRGMVIREMERCAHDLGLAEVTPEVLRHARATWAGSGSFHSEHHPSQYQSVDDSGTPS
ncbi:MAG: universal stress protein [Acidiferrobacteraceae bacterium]|nr:universal stress protein [Acidiferrobacteraceae bacterium]